MRSHRTIGLLIPRAAWWYGPFWVLLRADLRRGLTLITTLLHHAAAAKVAHLDQRDAEEKRLTVDLLGLGGRTYVGDSHVYGWYRGGTFGPEPCTSALLACERMMDQLVATGVSLRRVARLLLAGARDLASVGLVVGFLVRHLDLVTDELDDFLAVPELWDLELGRAGAEITGEPEIDDVEQLRCDVALARDLAAAPPAMSVGQAMEAVTAAAAAAVRVVATVDASALDQEDVAWATSCVLAAAQDSTCGKHVDEDSLFSSRADRSAAAALVYLLLPALDDNRPTPLRLEPTVSRSWTWHSRVPRRVPPTRCAALPRSVCAACGPCHAARNRCRAATTLRGPL